MEDDDEFGDLYTDVLRPLVASFQSQSQPASERPPPTQQKEIPKAVSSSFQKQPIAVNLNSDDDEDASLFAAPSSNSALQNQTQTSAKPGLNFRSGPMGFDLNKDSGHGAGNFLGLTGVESGAQSRVLENKGGAGKLPETSFGGSSLMDEPNIDVMVEDRDDKNDNFVVKDDDLVKRGKLENFIAGTGNVENFGAGGVESKAGEMCSDPIIPGVSIPGVSGGVGNRTNTNFEDEWDSDSEDDLQIVLNDNNHGPMGVDRMGAGGLNGEEDDEDDDGEPLVIVANDEDQTRQPMMTEEQEWGGEEVGPSSDGDRKDLGEAARVNGVGGVAVAPKIGFNHGYHHPFHSQFKVSDVAAHLGFGAFILLFDQNLKSKLPCKLSRLSWKLVTLELINAIISLCAGEIGCCTCCKFILINKFAYEFNGSFLFFNFAYVLMKLVTLEMSVHYG